MIVAEYIPMLPTLSSVKGNNDIVACRPSPVLSSILSQKIGIKFIQSPFLNFANEKYTKNKPL